MEEVSWKTMFIGKVNVVFDDKKEKAFFVHVETQLCIFAMQAIRVLRNEFLTGPEVVEYWRIKRFSPEERILEIEEIGA